MQIRPSLHSLLTAGQSQMYKNAYLRYLREKFLFRICVKLYQLVEGKQDNWRIVSLNASIFMAQRFWCSLNGLVTKSSWRMLLKIKKIKVWEILPCTHHGQKWHQDQIFETLSFSILLMGHIFRTSRGKNHIIWRHIYLKKRLVSGLLFFLQTREHANWYNPNQKPT